MECYQRAIGLDNYLAVAYFQQGVSNFLLGDFEEALANFNDTLLYLRGNTSIDYEQLGLKFRLYSCEVLFNRGLTQTEDRPGQLRLLLHCTQICWSTSVNAGAGNMVCAPNVRSQPTAGLMRSLRDGNSSQ